MIASSVELIANDQILNKLNVRALKSKAFLEGMHDAGNPLARQISCDIVDNAGCRAQAKSGTAQHLKTSMFHECQSLVIQELGIVHVRQILVSSVAGHVYGLQG